MLGGIIDGIKDVVGGVGDVLGGIGDIAGAIGNSPLGGLLSMVFPGAGAVLGAVEQFGGMADSLSDMVAGGEDY